jgi:hypothetical protein
MNEWLKRITPGRKITLNWKAVGRMGLREVLLLGIAIIQAIWLIFMVGSVAFELRFVCALLIATLLVCWASIPIRGLPAEKALFKIVRGALGAKRYKHQTARADALRGEGKVIDEQEAAKPKRGEANNANGEPTWAAPNLGLVAFVFMCLVTLSSVVMCLVRGSVPGLG